MISVGVFVAFYCSYIVTTICFLYPLLETLRCPKVSPIKQTCEGRIENECLSDVGCYDGTKCCPDRFEGDGGCSLVCEAPEVLGKYAFSVCFVVELGSSPSCWATKQITLSKNLLII